MPSLKNLLLYGLLLVSTANAIPTAAVESTLNETETLISQSLERRKNSNKCEAWFHVDTDSTGTESTYTEKFRISLLDKPGNTMGYDFNWNNLGAWYATNPNYFIKIRTTHGLELWVEGVHWKMLFKSGNDDLRTHGITLHYGSQHFSARACENWAYKSARPSNGWRNEYDMWCEFDC